MNLEKLLEGGSQPREHRPYWEEREDNTVFNTPVKGKEMHRSIFKYDEWEFKGEPVLPEEKQLWLIEAIQNSFFLTAPKEVRIEVLCDGEGIKFKVRKVFNKKVETGNLVSILDNLKKLRKNINNLGKEFKTCKVFFLGYESDERYSSYNVVFNPHWRRYENYEMLFRNKTQLRRATR